MTTQQNKVIKCIYLNYYFYNEVVPFVLLKMYTKYYNLCLFFLLIELFVKTLLVFYSDIFVSPILFLGKFKKRFEPVTIVCLFYKKL